MWKKVKKSILARETGLLSKKTPSLSKKIILSVCAGACFLAAQNPVMAAETITINNANDLDNRLSKETVHYTDTLYYTSSGKNIVIAGGNFNDIIIAGAYSETKAVTNGSVTLQTGTVASIYGGYNIDSGAANYNTVNITGGKVNGDIYGGCNNGYTSNSGAANYNTVNISAGTIDGTVYGGFSNKDKANHNIVKVTGGNINGDIYGGDAKEGSADNNEVHISNAKLKGSVYVACGATANENNLIITNSTFSGYSIYAALGAIGEANQNYMEITDTILNGNDLAIYAGNGSLGTANNNILSISGGEFTGTGSNIYGGYTYGENFDANANKVSITGATFTAGASLKNVYGGYSVNGSANENIVNLSDVTVSGNVFGGYTTNGENANGNTVNISSGTIGGTIYGGSCDAHVSGNTLNVKGLGIEAGDIGEFDNINFFIPSSATDGSTMLLLTTDENTDISAATVKAGVVAIEGDSNLKAGDTVNLIKKEAGELITEKAGVKTTFDKLTAVEGVSVDYDLVIEKKDNRTLVATINAASGAPDPGDGGEQGGGDSGEGGSDAGEGGGDSGEGGSDAGQGGSSGAKPTMKAQTKSLVETQAGGMAMLNSGMDMLAGEGIANAIAAAADNGSAAGGTAGKAVVNAGGGEFAMFGMLGASNMKYKTGSHVDMNGWNLGLGFAKTVENNAGKLTFGPAISYGKGSYDSYLDDGVHGEGDSDYFGIGLFVHQANKDGLYYEGSVSGGRVSNDYSSNDLVAAGGKTHVDYDTSGTYVGAHLGIGKILDVSEKAKLDIYGKYFYAHQAGDDAKLTTGETYHFDSIDSNRIRVGARYEMEAGKAAENGKALSTVYVGTAYEYEFSGDARATYKGMETPSPSLKGSSGMLELGWKVAPSAHSPLTIDMSANGWCGKKQGVGLKANFLWSF